MGRASFARVVAAAFGSVAALVRNGRVKAEVVARLAVTVRLQACILQKFPWMALTCTWYLGAWHPTAPACSHALGVGLARSLVNHHANQILK